MTGAERRRGAIEAAVAIARSLGVGFSNARVLGDSNNTIVHLAPSPVIAKVAILSTESRPSLGLERELEVGLHLAARGAPIAPPTASVPPGPHRHRRSLLTLWQLQPNDPHRDVPDAVLADALTEFHQAPDRLPGRTAALRRASRKSRGGAARSGEHAYLAGSRSTIATDSGA